MSKVKKYIYITIGLITLVIGAIGVVLPILPTTPFLLVSSYCFARGSERFHNWFINTKLYKNNLESFIKERAMTVNQKVKIVGLVAVMLSIPFILVDNLYMRIFLIALITFKIYYFTFRIKNKEEEKVK